MGIPHAFTRRSISSAVFLGLLSLFLLRPASRGAAAEEAEEAEVAPARLGILLDTSPEMGFLLPQVRKERRILNRQLAAAGRPEVPLREMEGASLDREGSISVGARKNLLYALRELFAEVDTVLWITALRGQQSGGGLLALEEMLAEKVEGRPNRRLLIRNIWQDQLQAGDTWLRDPPPLTEDPLALRNRPEGWYRLLAEGRGMILRSWQVPPPDFRECFGFPHRIVGAAFLSQLGIPDREAFFDQKFARDFTARHGLTLAREREEWPVRLTGRRWIDESTLLPFPDEAARVARAAAVLEELSARESIAEDLARIEADRLGVIFGFGYLEKDLKSHLAAKGAPPRSPAGRYLADVARIAGETLAFLKSVEASRADDENAAGAPVRFYVNERIELANNRRKPEGPDPYARHIANLARDHDVDAVYLFTNGYLGGGGYGSTALDLDLLALALRESSVRLYVRIPFEFGPASMDLTRLALASGGGVFQGRRDDPDWEIPPPEAAWPVATDEAP
ncbi:MAG: hypothetical protein GXX91_17565 [Verrucomicrobiaceae bacterium]|nr:hypothetical protein [Verrucomicrobiaceae bacterium]